MFRKIWGNCYMYILILKLSMGSETTVVEISSSDEEDNKPRRSLKRSWKSTVDKDSDDDVLIIEKPLFFGGWNGKKRLKGGEDVEALDDDCIILNSDPEKIDFGSDTKDSGSNDLMVVAERGPVACRDYPHPRHLCAKFIFRTTPHERHCELCHCYVCEKVAPCSRWRNGHCDASDKEERWRRLRHSYRLAHPFSRSNSH